MLAIREYFWDAWPSPSNPAVTSDPGATRIQALRTVTNHLGHLVLLFAVFLFSR